MHGTLLNMSKSLYVPDNHVCCATQQNCVMAITFVQCEKLILSVKHSGLFARHMNWIENKLAWLDAK